MAITLDESQAKAADAIAAWYKENNRKVTKNPKHFALAGLAGTGKTTIVKYIMEALDLDPTSDEVAFCAFTGKAALVLTRKGTPATTMHRLMYHVKEDPKTKKVYFVRRDRLPDSLKLIVIDEASMVSKELQGDIESFKVPILYVGDHGQLPPVGDENNRMLKADVILNQIHRQAEDNPIIKLSKLVRLGARLPFKEFAPGIRKIYTSEVEPYDLESADQILCGKNKTRDTLNRSMLKLLDYDPAWGKPERGQRIICLRNDYSLGLTNGQTGVITDVRDFEYPQDDCEKWKYPEDLSALDFNSEDSFEDIDEYSNIPFQDAVFSGGTPDQKERKVIPFDWAYAITVHKAQGSQYLNPIIYEEWLGDSKFHAKWLYTAITRAAEKVTIVANKPKWEK